MPKKYQEFTLSGSVVFRTLDANLWHTANPDDVITLGLTSSRILTYLLNNKGETISRDELLDKIWSEYGLQPSMHSLNQNLSIIRKNLSHLGCDHELIKTIPRTGYFIAPEQVEVKVIEEDLSVSLPPDMDTVKKSHDIAARNGKERGMFFRTLKYVSFLFFTIALLAPTLYIMFVSDDRPLQDARLYPLRKVGNCPVYSTVVGSPDTNKIRMKIITDYKKLPACMSGGFYIINIDEQITLLNTEGRFFIAYCNKAPLSKNLISECKSIYERQYSVH